MCPRSREVRFRNSQKVVGWVGVCLRILLDSTSEFGVSQDVVSLKLGWRYALEIEDLDDGSRESALGFVGGAFHE